MTDARVSQVMEVVVGAGDPEARISQVVEVVVATGDPQARSSQVMMIVVGSARTVTPPPPQAQFLAG